MLEALHEWPPPNSLVGSRKDGGPSGNTPSSILARNRRTLACKESCSESRAWPGGWLDWPVLLPTMQPLLDGPSPAPGQLRDQHVGDLARQRSLAAIGAKSRTPVACSHTPGVGLPAALPCTTRQGRSRRLSCHQTACVVPTGPASPGVLLVDAMLLPLWPQAPPKRLWKSKAQSMEIGTRHDALHSERMAGWRRLLVTVVASQVPLHRGLLSVADVEIPPLTPIAARLQTPAHSF